MAHWDRSRTAAGLAAVLAACALTGGAQARAPEPVRAVPPALYFGRWYQVAEIANGPRLDCPDAIDDFAVRPGGGFAVTIDCAKEARRITGKGRVIPGAGGAKFSLSLFGGLINKEYWVLDHAPDRSWALMATPGGNYLWILARTPRLDPAQMAAAIARISALGYNPARLVEARFAR